MNNKEYIITQEELDTLEAIRLKLYITFADSGEISDIIRVATISCPLWKIINKNRKTTELYIALESRARELSKSFSRVYTPKEVYEEMINLDYALQEINND